MGLGSVIGKVGLGTKIGRLEFGDWEFGTRIGAWKWRSILNLCVSSPFQRSANGTVQLK